MMEILRTVMGAALNVKKKPQAVETEWRTLERNAENPD